MGHHVACYLRISKDDDDNRLGVTRQRADTTALAARMYPGVDVQFYEDNDISAYSGKARPGFAAITAGITAGMVHAVIAYDMDRMFRQPRELEAFIDLCATNTFTRVHTCASDFDLASNDGQLMARIMVAVARKASDDSSRRLRRSLAGRRQAGLHHGPAPFGYVATAGALALHDTEAPAMRQAAQRVIQGASLRSVALWLNQQCTRRWEPSHLGRALQRPVYAGRASHRGDITGDGAWPALWDLDTHETLCALLAGRPAPLVARAWWLSGLVTCGCGKMKVSGPRDRTNYRCCDAFIAKSCGIAIGATKLHDEVERQLLAALDAPRPDLGKVESEESPAESVERQLIERRLEEIADLFARGSISARQLDVATERLRIELTRATEEDRIARTIVTQNNLKAGARLRWSDLGVQDKNHLASLFIKEVRILPATRRGPVFDLARIDVRWVDAIEEQLRLVHDTLGDGLG